MPNDNTDAVRNEFRDRRKVIGPLSLHPVSFQTLFILEHLQHPLFIGTQPGQERMSIRDTARIIYPLIDPEKAGEILLEEGVNAFDAEAMRAAIEIPPAVVHEVNEWLAEEFAKIGTRNTENASVEAAPAQTRAEQA